MYIRTLALSIALVTLSSIPSYANEEQVSVLYNKFTTFLFTKDIVEAKISSADYKLEMSGRYLLVRARNAQVATASLFVVYGKEKHSYVAALYPSNKAPLKRHIQESVPVAPVAAEAAPKHIAEALFANSPAQEYYSIGMKRQGGEVILTNILHVAQDTYLRFFIYNRTSIPFTVPYHSFENVTYTSRVPFFAKKKKKSVETTYAPATLKVAAKSGAYFVFSVPTYASGDGLDVFLGEGSGERGFHIFVPSKLLLHAPRQQSTNQ